MEDNELAAAAAQGDQQAFALLVERYRPYIYTIAYKITLDQEDALDVTQNVMLRLVQRIGSFQGQGAFRSWLAAIAANEACNSRRSPHRQEVAAETEELAQILDDQTARQQQPGPREAYEMRQRRELVGRAVAELSPQQRAIIILTVKEDMKPKEVAQRLGLAENQTRSQLHRALVRLRQVLAGAVRQKRRKENTR